MSDWRWVTLEVVLAVHEEQLAEHGGASGLRDMALLESALARPRNRAAYATADAADLAAAYAFGLACDHPFTDGNKRMALVVAELFLALNGLELTAEDGDCVTTVLRLAAGELAEAELATWMRRHTGERRA